MFTKFNYNNWIQQAMLGKTSSRQLLPKYWRHNYGKIPLVLLLAIVFIIVYHAIIGDSVYINTTRNVLIPINLYYYYREKED